MRISEREMRKRGARKKSGVNFSAIFVIIVISILAGYLTTRFIVYPIIGEKDTSILTKIQNMFQLGKGGTEQENGDAQEGEGAPETDEDGSPNVVDDGLAVNDGDNGEEASNEAVSAASPGGYSIQFGSFSTRGAAEKLVSQLSSSGISAEIVEKDGAYKVLGKLFDTKEEAVAARQQLEGEAYEDAFITERQEQK